MVGVLLDQLRTGTFTVPDETPGDAALPGRWHLFEGIDGQLGTGASDVVFNFQLRTAYDGEMSTGEAWGAVSELTPTVLQELIKLNGAVGRIDSRLEGLDGRVERLESTVATMGNSVTKLANDWAWLKYLMGILGLLVASAAFKYLFLGPRPPH